MNPGERIKLLRKDHLHMTQEAFGERINLTRANIANIESGRISLTDRVLQSICKEFSVSEMWIKNGTGEIFIEMTSDEKAYLKFGQTMEGENEFKKVYLKAILDLPDEAWDYIYQQFKQAAAELEEAEKKEGKS